MTIPEVQAALLSANDATTRALALQALDTGVLLDAARDKLRRVRVVVVDLVRRHPDDPDVRALRAMFAVADEDVQS